MIVAQSLLTVPSSAAPTGCRQGQLEQARHQVAQGVGGAAADSSL
jgi:hypothetical protein